MKRPLELVGFCYLLTLAAAVSFGADASFVLFWCCLALFAGSVAVRKTRAALVFPAAFLTAAVAFGSFAAYTRAAVEPPRVLDGADAVVEGEICELPYSQYGRWYYVVRLDSVSVPDAPQSFKIRLSAQHALEAEPYSRIRGKVHFFLPQGGSGYGSRSYQASKGILMTAYLYEYEDVSVEPPRAKPPYYYALRVRQAMLDSVDSMLPPEEAGMVKGVFLGDKTGLSDGTISDFQTDGVSHLLAVSGMHMAAIAQFLLWLLRRLRVKEKPASLFAGAGVFCFMAITGFVPSVARSGIMCLLYLSASLFSRRADPLNSLGVSVLILCLPNPYAAADVGLLLSFFATLGLIMLSGPIQKRLDARFDRVRSLGPFVRGLDGTLAASAAAILFTLPVILLSFGTVSLVAPIANLLLVFPSTVLIGAASAGTILGLFAPQSFLLLPFALASGLISKYLLACAHLLAKIPYASVSASYGFVYLWLGGSLVLFAAAWALRGGRRLAVTAGLLSAAILLTGIVSYRIDGRGVTRVAVLDTGTGLSVAVTRDGRAAVFGCGGYNANEITGYFIGRNVRRIDELNLLTQEREEAVNSAAVAARLAPAALAALPASRADGYAQKAAAGSGAARWDVDPGVRRLWDDIEVRSAPCGEASAVRLGIDGVSVLLLPRQADASLLPREWLSPDFLVTDMSPGEETGLNPVCTVLSMEEDDLRALTRPRDSTLWTGGFGRIILEFRGDRVLSVGREV